MKDYCSIFILKIIYWREFLLVRKIIYNYATCSDGFVLSYLFINFTNINIYPWHYENLFNTIEISQYLVTYAYHMYAYILTILNWKTWLRNSNIDARFRFVIKRNAYVSWNLTYMAILTHNIKIIAVTYFYALFVIAGRGNYYVR